MKQQPAKINYFYKDGYREFFRTVGNTLGRGAGRAVLAWEDVKESFGDLIYYVTDVFSFDGWDSFTAFFQGIWAALRFGFDLGKLIFGVTFTLGLTLVFAAFQLGVLVTFMTLFYICFLIFAGADALYCSLKKIATSCPNCQEKYSLPTYVCECGAHHTQLKPSARYGVLTRECECGRKLRTTFFNGREKLPGDWICPTCSYELGGAPLQTDIPIPVVGGPSSGKTCYINMVISELEKNANAAYGLDFQYKPNDALGDDFEENKENMSNGRLPLKTNDTRLHYYQFYLTPHGNKVKNLISICDVAGETYENNDEIGRQIGYKYANAFMMVIDPLSVMKFREEVADKVDLGKYGASERAIDEILGTLINTLENMKCLNSKNMMKTDVAVIFSKGDIPGLAEKIGPEVVAKVMAENGIENKYDAMNKVCEDFLIEYEEQNFLNNLKSKFKSIQFFTCSALGHVEDGNAFVPTGVEEPALWLIDKASDSINLKQIWGKKI